MSRSLVCSPVPQHSSLHPTKLFALLEKCVITIQNTAISYRPIAPTRAIKYPMANYKEGDSQGLKATLDPSQAQPYLKLGSCASFERNFHLHPPGNIR